MDAEATIVVKEQDVWDILTQIAEAERLAWKREQSLVEALEEIAAQAETSTDVRRALEEIAKRARAAVTAVGEAKR